MARQKSPPPPPSSADEIEQQFYEALQHGDIERLMATWADDDEISCVHPGGPRLVGMNAIRASFEAMFARGPIVAAAESVRRVQSHASAVHSVVERVRVSSAEGEQVGWLVATNVYLKTPQGWRMVAHHASHAGTVAMPDIGEGAAVLH